MEKRMSWSEGWHEVSKTLRILVEDGMIVRGVENDDRTVYPYRKSAEGGYDRCYHGVKADKRHFEQVRFF